MKPFFYLIISSFFSFSLTAQQLYFPPLQGDEWETISPESLNWCTDQIDELMTYLEEENSKSFIVLKDGKIVFEEYFDNFSRDSLWVWFSAGKTLSAVLVGIAEQEGLLDINDKTSDYLGEGWTNLEPEDEAKITIWHQLTMTSGLDEAGNFCTVDSCLTYKADAGDRWFYHNAPYSLLRPVLEEATGVDLNIYTFNKFRNTIGMRGFWLRSGFNNFYLSTARDMARFGLMIQNQGTWDQTKVLDHPDYYQAMITPSQSLNPSYGYLWWLNGQGAYIPPGISFTINQDMSPDAPQDVFLAAGANGQFISISPSNGLIMIRQGQSGDSSLVPVSFHNEIWKRLMAVACTPTSTQTPSSSPFQIYPNPTSDELHISFNTSNDFTLKLFDFTGKLLLEDYNTNHLSFADLPAGLYHLHLQQGSNHYSQKIIKN